MYALPPSTQPSATQPATPSGNSSDLQPDPRNPRILLEHYTDSLLIDTVSGATRILPLPKADQYPWGIDQSALYVMRSSIFPIEKMQAVSLLSGKPQGTSWKVPTGSFLVDGDVEVASPGRHTYFVARTVHGPFRHLRGYVPDDQRMSCQLVRSNFYGTLMVCAIGGPSIIYEVDSPKPIPERAPH